MQPTTQQEREHQTVSGTIQGIIQKSPESWQVSVLPDDSQYPKNLWSKDPAFIADMERRRGQKFDFDCTISHWTRQDGQPVRSLWVAGVAAYGSMVAPQQPQPQQQPTQQGGVQYQQNVAQPAQSLPAGSPAPPPTTPPVTITQEVKETRIMRQTATKVAAIMIGYAKPEDRTPENLEMMAEWCMRYYVGGPRGSASESAQDGQGAPPEFPPEEEMPPAPRNPGEEEFDQEFGY